MDYKTCCDIFNIQDITFLPVAAHKLIEGSIEDRHKVYLELLKANNFDVSKDWFQPIYEAELSEGKRKGQHFTPNSVNNLVNALADHSKRGEWIHEPTAGTGSLVIANWWNSISVQMPWEVKPSNKFYGLWELSDRALPLLLINLSIRGMNAEVFHGDVLEKKVMCHYIIVNYFDDPLAFSDIVIDSENKLKVSRS